MSVKRIDVVEAPEWLSSKFGKTPEGFLIGRATVTNIGVFTYRYGDGRIVRELRPPEEVFSSDSAQSLVLKPITLDHPDSFVTEENVKELAVGHTGKDIYNDNIYLSVDMLIHKPEAIEAVKNGKNYLSCGYTCDIEETPGRWLGVDYDVIQRNIRYNHVAIVDSPRAGETAKIKMDHMDSADAILIENTKEDNMSDELKMKVDEAEKLISTLNKTNADLQVKLDSLTQEKTALEAERDTLKDKVDSLEQKLKEVESKVLDEKAIAEKVASKVALVDQAKSIGADVKVDMSDIEIKKAVILKVFPKANLDGKSDAYIEARYDAAIEYNTEIADAKTRTLNLSTDSDSKDLVAEARQKYLERLRNKA